MTVELAMPSPWRDDFGDFEGVAYLNAAFHGPMPRVALAAAEASLRLKAQPFRIRDEDYFDLPEAYRTQAAALLGADANDVAVTDSTIHGITCFTLGLDWQVGDEVLIPAGEFPSNRFPWLALAGRGVVVREVAISSASGAVAEFEAACTSRTRVIAVGWVHYANGRRLDLAALGELARQRGALFVIDGTQGLGGLPFSLAETPCDLVACSGYKWLLGPYGLGFAWFSPALQQRLAAPRINWFALRGARDFSKLAGCALELEPGARRFDGNETASFFNLPAGTAALAYLRAIGPGIVAAHARTLLDRVVAGLPRGFQVVSEHDPRFRSNLLCIASDDAAVVDSGFEELQRRDVRVSRREGALRISPHLYNDAHDVDRLLDGLEAASGHGAASHSAGRARSRGAASLPVGAAVSSGSLAPEPRRLSGNTIELRPLAASDTDALYRISHGDAEREALWTYLAYGPFANAAAMGAWIEACAASTDPLFLAVVERASGLPIGMASYLSIVPSMRRLEIGHLWYAPQWQRGRANRETCELLLREAFETLDYRRVEWKCDALNLRSRRAALRLGFRYEGLFRQHMISKGRNRDTAWYAMTAEEWRQRAAAALPVPSIG